MNKMTTAGFSKFLKTQVEVSGCGTVKEYYEYLGGLKSLSISLRHFQLIISGKRNPTIELLRTIFKKIDPEHYKNAITSFFDSNVGSNSSDQILDYLKLHLSHPIKGQVQSPWDTASSVLVLSESQLKLLNGNHDALRTFNRIMLFAKVSANDPSLDQVSVKALMKAKLIIKKGSFLEPIATFFRIPSSENAPPRIASEANRLVLSYIDGFVSLEGAPNQTLQHHIELYSPEVASNIIEQINSLKRWIQNAALDEKADKKKAVPVVSVLFAKHLTNKDL